MLDETIDEYVSVRPAPRLRPFVERYSGYRQRGTPPAVHRGLPSPYLTVILTLDEPITVRAHPDAAQPGGDYTSLIGGLHTSPAIITHEGAQSGVQLNLHPLGARLLLGLPAGELRHLDVPGEAVLGPLALELHDRLRTAKTWPARFAELDGVLLRVLGRAEVSSSSSMGVAPEVSRAWALLRAGEGRVSVLAREVDWSPRHLSARLATETGLTPKIAARVLRFDRARRLLPYTAAPSLASDSAPTPTPAPHRAPGHAPPAPSARPAPPAPPVPPVPPVPPGPPGPASIAEVAARCGYFDQAHLAREFRALAGLSPSAWLRAEFRSVQAQSLAQEQDDHHD